MKMHNEGHHALKRLRVKAKATQNAQAATPSNKQMLPTKCCGHWSKNKGRTISTAAVSGR